MDWFSFAAGCGFTIVATGVLVASACIWSACCVAAAQDQMAERFSGDGQQSNSMSQIEFDAFLVQQRIRHSLHVDDFNL